MGTFAKQLSQTAITWANAVAPHAEWVCRMLWSTIRRRHGRFNAPTHLTQSHRRTAKGNPMRAKANTPKPPKVCKSCGAPIKHRTTYCDPCAAVASAESLVKVSRDGRIAAHTAEAEFKRAATLRSHHAARQNWNPSDQPTWLNEETYRKRIQPRLSEITVRDISSALGISAQYSTHIRAGKRIPHPRHWQTLAKLAEVSHS